VNPKDRVIAYLNQRKSTIESSTVDQVVKDVKLSVFYGFNTMPDDEIRTIVVQWASFNAVGLLVRQPAGSALPAPGSGATSSNSSSEMVDAVKKAIKTINDGVTFGKKDGDNINIGVSGLTANLKGTAGEAALNISWTGGLTVDANSGPFYFTGTLTKDKWEMVLSFPQDTYIPNLATLGKVFSEGEKAFGKMGEATRGFNNIQDVGKVGALVKPHVASLQEAVEAVSGIAKANKKGGASFGFKIGSPDPMPGQQGIPGGVQGQLVFTYTF